MALPQINSLIQSNCKSKSNTNSESNFSSELASSLSLLFEPSPILTTKLVPELIHQLYSSTDRPTNYSELIDQTLGVVNSWELKDKAEFVGGHPRIGEIKAPNTLSAMEQGQTNTSAATPPDVLERLAFLNKAYERKYPKLVYITFVNGRSRAQIRDEMEERLKLEGVLPAADEYHSTNPGLEGIVPHDENSDAWRKEVDRAVYDVGRIAKSRLEKLGYY